jgi:uncharacterized protein with HEPN domain
MANNPTLRIHDVLREIEVLHDIEKRYDLKVFRASPIARRATAFAIQTISEAVRHIPDDWLDDYPGEPWAEIRATGNKMRHEYFRIEDAILWEVVTRDSYNLKTVMLDMLKHHGVGK